VTTRDIRPSTAITVCDVCGRTMLRGERAEAYIHGGARRWVCELCKSRALHEGWVREGTVPSYDGASAGPERRRSLLGRLRGRREGVGNSSDTRSSRELDEELDAAEAPAGGWSEPAPAPPPPSDGARTRRERVREPRHVRAIPTSTEQKTASAVELFNSSEHTRIVSGVARSLGLPTVAVTPSDARASLVNVVVSWELCWYRYEVDLSDEVPSVRVAGQGYELEELTAEERQPNAVADDGGLLSLER
jgi:hypothetical protein